LALFCIAACSFPEYRAGGGSSAGGTSSACSDATQNGDETGVDCGGSCDPCPSCTDGLHNGSESDEDCGGICSARCETNQRCRANADCASLVCSSVCQPSNCQDEVRNGLETGVDCGGGSCMACDNGTACKSSDDCISMRCKNDVCVSADCTDGVINGDESDTDCGGDDCAPCVAEKKCRTNGDCESDVCEASACAAATCDDRTRNQGESDLDCGGPSCPPCGEGMACLKPRDCESALCQSGMCVPEAAKGQALSKNTWTIHTSESATESGLPLMIDGDVETCWSSGTPQYAGMYVEVDLGKPRYFFKALLLATACHDEFPASIDVYVSNDGSFGDPVQMSVSGSHWTWITFQSAQVGRYVRFVATRDAGRNWSIGDLELYD
jgi:hypothetical protein